MASVFELSERWEESVEVEFSRWLPWASFSQSDLVDLGLSFLLFLDLLDFSWSVKNLLSFLWTSVERLLLLKLG